ncbi:hypothetical protein M8J76_000651 [Diaphorina citri]|nr:hypothetical protein M8J76_000651 [Diaphorina citri]
MSGSIQGPDTGYILVPQVISESDSSEEDITKFVKEHGFHIITSKAKTATKASISPANKIVSKLMSNAKKSKMNKQLEVLFKRPMSTSRKLAFVLSILMCFVTVAVFLWVIPCDWSACPCKSEDANSASWSISAAGIELEGPITIARDKLLFMMRSPIFERRQMSLRSGQPPPTGGGLIALDSVRPVELWRKTLNNVPKEVDCGLIDINLDGVLDCIVIADNGYLAVLSQATGNLLWRKTNNGYKDGKMKFPLIVDDLTGDGVNDLVLISYMGPSKYQLALLSGSNGVQIGTPLVKEDCDQMTGLNLTSPDTVIYVCVQGERERVASVSISDMYKSRSKSTASSNIDESASHTANGNTASPPVAKLPPQHKSTKRQNMLTLDKYHLVIENTGVCPDHCSAVVNISDDTNHTVYSFNASKTYIMQPLIIHFNNAANGFLLKYWEWQPDKEEQEDYYDKDKIIIIRHLQERIVLVMFSPDGTPGPHIVNASQSDIIQLCHSNSCQPGTSLQEYSLLLADLDKDGSQDLISYLVTYAGPDKSSDIQTWSLVSQIRVIRLEHELPKLYEFLHKSGSQN